MEGDSVDALFTNLDSWLIDMDLQDTKLPTKQPL